MDKEKLISELAKIIVEEGVKLSDIQKEIADECSRLRFENESEYFKKVRDNLKKIGYDRGYNHTKMSIYVLENIHTGADSVNTLISKIAASTGTSEKMIYQNMFLHIHFMYSALKFAMMKYIPESRKDVKKDETERFWNRLDDSSKLKLYIELEEYLYNL